MNDSMDMAGALIVGGGVALAISAHAMRSSRAGPSAVDARVAREQPFPLVGRAPMAAVYRALQPLARACIAIGISANAITLTSLVLAAVAAVLFATGHFGSGGAVACAAALLDAVDGIVARETHTASAFGKILDTTVDRYVDAMLVGGIAVYLRTDLLGLLIALGALVAGFMISYASAVLRELGIEGENGSMRRPHRLAYILLGVLLVPASHALFAQASLRARLAPLLFALAAIAIVGNASAVRRLVVAARRPTPRDVEDRREAPQGILQRR